MPVASRYNLLIRGFSLSANSSNLALVNNPNIDSKIGINKIVKSIAIAKNKESENISPLPNTKSCLLIRDVLSWPINIHWLKKDPIGTKIDSWSNWALLLILPPRRDTIEAQTNKIKNKLLLITISGSGQIRLAIDTQAKAVMLPIPWEIINAGGIIIDNGLMVEANVNFVTCTAKRRVIIKKICLEEIVGFSFFETNIKTPELISISVNVKNQEKISAIFKGEIRSSL